MATKIRPVGDRVVVRPSAKEEMTSSGLIISNSPAPSASKRSRSRSIQWSLRQTYGVPPSLTP
jgi:co-chaperonin GroES (HSP10)